MTFTKKPKQTPLFQQSTLIAKSSFDFFYKQNAAIKIRHYLFLSTSLQGNKILANPNICLIIF